MLFASRRRIDWCTWRHYPKIILEWIIITVIESEAKVIEELEELVGKEIPSRGEKPQIKV